MASLKITPAPIFWIDDASGNIGTVNLDTGAVTAVGASGIVLTDIAFSPSEQLFGESFTTLYSINQTTGAASRIGNFGGGASLNGLVFGTNGTLYSSGGTGLYTINTTTGAAHLVGNSGLQGGFTSEGDLAFHGGTLYESVTNGSVSDLAKINPATGAGTLVGQIVGNAQLFGLVAGSNGDLYGIAGTNIYSVNTTTGAGTLVQSYSSPSLGAAYGAASKTEAVICFLSGTRIATPKGETPVEQLVAGDAILTLRGETRRIVWVGRGRMPSRRGARRGARDAAAAVTVRQGALADNVPDRDLRMTKAHALFIDQVLIPVEFLVNHRSVVWDDQAANEPLYHIELETHDVLVANGAPAESYRDDGNRWLFQNANSGWTLPQQQPCAPVLTGGPAVDAVWHRLLNRTGPRGSVPLTADPDLHLLVDGRRLDVSTVRGGGVHTFRLPHTPKTIRVVSRAAAPAELGLARDPRVLGVGVRKAAVWKGARLALIEADDGKLTSGFHGYEPDTDLRWTDGDAALPSELFADFAGPLELELHITGAAQYPLPERTHGRIAT